MTPVDELQFIKIYQSQIY